MPTSTYVSLATYTIPSGTDTEVVFSSIPATYRDLIVIVAGSATAAASFGVRLNSDTGSNYTYVLADGNGSTASSGSGTLTYGLAGRISTSQSVSVMQIMDYSASDKHTTILGRGNAADDIVRMNASRWANTAVVNSVSVMNATFNAGTTFSLYAIAS
jgi:hypothetical protein